MVAAKDLLKALKDPISYGKFISGQDQVGSVSYSVTGQQAIDKNAAKSLTLIQNLLKNQIANQRVPVQFVKNDFKREKINHQEIEQRINDSNSLSREINRIAEDFRATLFNIGNMREFDSKLQSLLQTDINELLNTQKELTLAQSTNEFKGDYIKKISYIQEKMYKTMEKIQHHFVVQQDIRKKEPKQNIVINVGGGKGGQSGAIPKGPQDNSNSTGTSFLDSLFQYLGLRKLFKGAGAVAAGKAAGKMAGDALAKGEKQITRNSAKFRLFCKKHPWLGKMSRFGQKYGKIGIVSSVVTAAAVYGISALDEAEYDSLLGAFSRSLSNISKGIKDSWFGEVFGFGGSSMKMKDFYNQSYYMANNSGITGSFNLGDHAAEALAPRAITRVLGYGGEALKYTKNLGAYALGKGLDKTKSLANSVKNIPAKLKIHNLKKEIAALNDIIYISSKNAESFAKTGNKMLAEANYKIFSQATDRAYINQNRIDRLQGKIKDNIPSRVKPVFARNEVLKKFSSKIPVFGAVAGGALAIPDVINYFSVDMDAQCTKAIEILDRDWSKFKNNFLPIRKKIIDNMKSARRWWLATIIKSITLSAVNIGVGAGTAGTGLAVSIFATSIVDWGFNKIRDLWLGFDFDKIDFENPYTFISQKELVEATSVSFLFNNIDLNNLEKEFKESDEARAAAQSVGVNAHIHYTNNNLLVTDFVNFNDTTKVKNPELFGEDTAVNNVYWGRAIMGLVSFVNGRSVMNYDSKKLYGSTKTISDYYDIASNVGSVSSPIYYPEKLTSSCTSIYEPYIPMAAANLSTILGSANNDWIKNVGAGLRFLYSISMIFYNNINVRLMDQLTKYVNDEPGLIHGLFYTVAVEFTSLFALVNGMKDGAEESIKNHKAFAKQLIPLLKSVNSLHAYGGDHTSLSKIIKNYVLIYLLYVEKYRDTSKVDTLRDFGVDAVRTLVIILRSEKDWKTIYDYFNANKEQLLSKIKQDNVNLSELNVNISGSSSFDNSSAGISESSFVDSALLLKAANDTRIISDLYENNLSADVTSSNDVNNKRLVAAKLTQDIFKLADIGVAGAGNRTISNIHACAIADMALNYFSKLVKASKEGPQSYQTFAKYMLSTYGIANDISLDSVQDVINNYPLLLQGLLKNSEFKTEVYGIISSICNTAPTALDNPQTLKGFYESLINSQRLYYDKDKQGGYPRDITWNGTNLLIQSQIHQVQSPFSDSFKDVPSQDILIKTGSQLKIQGFELGGDNGTAQGSPVNDSISADQNNGDTYITERAAHLAEIVTRNVRHDGKAGDCALYVRQALDEAGYNRKGEGMGHAYTYTDIERNNQNKLELRGFTEVTGTSELLPGDIGVLNKTKEHQYGHVQIWNGTRWVSDFLQNPNKSGPYKKYKSGIAPGQTLRIFRDKGDKKPGSRLISASSVKHVDFSKQTAYNNSIESKSGNSYSTYGQSTESFNDNANTQINVINAQQPTQSDMEADAMKSEDGIAEALFIIGVENDVLFGTDYNI